MPGRVPTSRTPIPGERPPNPSCQAHHPPPPTPPWTAPPTAGAASRATGHAGCWQVLPTTAQSHQQMPDNSLRNTEVWMDGAYEFLLKAFCGGTPLPAHLPSQHTRHCLPGPRAPTSPCPDQLPKGLPPSCPSLLGSPTAGRPSRAPPAQPLLRAQGPPPCRAAAHQAPQFLPHTCPRPPWPTPLLLSRSASGLLSPTGARTRRRDPTSQPLPAALLTHCPHPLSLFCSHRVPTTRATHRKPSRA